MILKENVARENEKSECVEKSETTLCELQPVDPDFAELPIPSTSELGNGILCYMPRSDLTHTLFSVSNKLFLNL